MSDDNFYSNLAAEVDEESDVSEADVSKMLADMDDMDDALFGSSLKPRPADSPGPKQPRRTEDLANPPAKANNNGKTSSLDKTLEEELTKALDTSSKIEESPTASPRRSSKPKTNAKKFDFGEFDEDDPLAGLLSDDDDDDGKSKKPTGRKRRKGSVKVEPEKMEPELKPEPELEPDLEPKDDTENLSEKRGSTGNGDQSAKPDASPARKPNSKTINFDDDDLDDDSDILGSLGLGKTTKGSDAKLEVSSSRPARSRVKTEPDADFDDESDLLGSLGLGTSPRETRRSRPEDSQEAERSRRKVNELFGSSNTRKMLDKPPAGVARKSQLDKILQRKDHISAPKAQGKEDKEDDFSFGDYTPSSVMARPESAPPSRRSVRFLDEDNSVGTSSLDRPRSRAGMSSLLDKPQQRPQSATPGTTTGGGGIGGSGGSGGGWRTGGNSMASARPDDWLELAAGANRTKAEERSKVSEKTAPIIDKDPQMKTPQHKPLSRTSESSTKEETKSSPVKAKAEESPAKVPSAADYLGLSDTEIDLDSLVQPKALTPPLNSTQNDPFSAPTKRETLSPFPWDSSTSQARAHRQPVTSTPQPEDDFDTDDDQEPLRASMMAQQLQQLQRMQEQQQQQQKPPAGRQATADRSPTPQQTPTQIPREQPAETGSQSQAQTGAKREPQWRQQMREKQQQQQQQQDRTVQQQQQQQLGSSSGGGWAGPGLPSSEEQHAAVQPSDIRQLQPSYPLVSATQPSSLPGYTPTPALPSQQATPPPPQLAPPAGTAWLDHALEKQQAQWASQQQALQQQLQQLQQQQQQLQMQEAVLLKAQTAPSGAASPLLMPGLTGYALEGKIQQLEAEKRRLEAELLAVQHAQHQKETAVENAHKDYIRLLEESAERREARLRLEHAAALQQYEQRLQQLQEDRAAQQQQQQQRVQQLSAEHGGQLQQLQQTHRLAMDAVQQQHERQLQQVQLAMQQETEALHSAQTHSKSLRAAVEQVQSTSKELGCLRSQVQGQHQSRLEQRSAELREKDQQLQALEKRLADQQDEMIAERARLEALVGRLEAQIRHQNSQLDEERFRLRQEQSKLNSLQRATEEDRKLAAEQLASQQASLQHAKDAILDDQKTSTAQCLEERKALAAERAQAATARRQLEASLQEQATKAMQVSAEQEGKLESLASERSRLAARAASLQQRQQALQQEQQQVSQRRQELDSEQRRLQQLAETLRQRSQQIQETVAESVQAREEGQSALQAARTIEAEHASRELHVQGQLQTLRAAQRQIAQERLDAAREQRNLEKMRGSLRCQMCGGTVPSLKTPGILSPSPAWSDNNVRYAPRRNHSVPSPNDDGRNPERDTAPSRALSLKDVDTLLSQVELGHTLRAWKVRAEKDKEFLEEESIFLETLKTPVPAV